MASHRGGAICRRAGARRHGICLWPACSAMVFFSLTAPLASFVPCLVPCRPPQQRERGGPARQGRSRRQGRQGAGPLCAPQAGAHPRRAAAAGPGAQGGALDGQYNAPRRRQLWLHHTQRGHGRPARLAWPQRACPGQESPSCCAQQMPGRCSGWSAGASAAGAACAAQVAGRPPPRLPGALPATPGPALSRPTRPGPDSGGRRSQLARAFAGRLGAGSGARALHPAHDQPSGTRPWGGLHLQAYVAEMEEALERCLQASCTIVSRHTRRAGQPLAVYARVSGRSESEKQVAAAPHCRSRRRRRGLPGAAPETMASAATRALHRAATRPSSTAAAAEAAAAAAPATCWLRLTRQGGQGGAWPCGAPFRAHPACLPYANLPPPHAPAANGVGCLALS